MFGLLFVVSVIVFTFLVLYMALFYRDYKFNPFKFEVENFFPIFGAGVLGSFAFCAVYAEGGFAWESSQELWGYFLQNTSVLIFMTCMSAGLSLLAYISINYLNGGHLLFAEDKDDVFGSICLSMLSFSGMFFVLLFIFGMDGYIV